MPPACQRDWLSLAYEEAQHFSLLRAVEILDIILRDEIGHVAIGNHWYRHLCAQRGLEPVATYAALALQYGAPRSKGPLNLSARRQAGFDEIELALLSQNT